MSTENPKEITLKKPIATKMGIRFNIGKPYSYRIILGKVFVTHQTYTAAMTEVSLDNINESITL